MGKHSGERPRAEGRRASATLLGRASGWQGLCKAQAAGIRQPGPGGLPALPRPGHPAVAPIQPVFTETRTSRAPMMGLTGSSSSRCKGKQRAGGGAGPTGPSADGSGGVEPASCVRPALRSPASPLAERVPGGGAHAHVARRARAPQGSPHT